MCSSKSQQNRGHAFTAPRCKACAPSCAGLLCCAFHRLSQPAQERSASYTTPCSGSAASTASVASGAALLPWRSRLPPLSLVLSERTLERRADGSLSYEAAVPKVPAGRDRGAQQEHRAAKIGEKLADRPLELCLETEIVESRSLIGGRKARSHRCQRERETGAVVSKGRVRARCCHP